MKKYFLPALFIFTPMIAFANPGAYVQGEVGQITVHSDAVSGGGSLGEIFNAITGENGISGRISTGYLWGDDNFNYGVETGLLYFPNADDSFTDNNTGEKGKIEYSGFNLDLLGVAKYTFDSGINLFAKAGVAYLHQKMDVYYAPAGRAYIHTANTSGNKLAPEVAAGFGYQFNPNWEMGVTYSLVLAGNGPNVTVPANATTFANVGNPVARTSTISLGLTYHFA